MLCLQWVKSQDIILALLADEVENVYVHFKYKKYSEILIFHRKKDINCRDFQGNEYTYIILATEKMLNKNTSIMLCRGPHCSQFMTPRKVIMIDALQGFFQSIKQILA
jgi:hypothetical protein